MIIFNIRAAIIAVIAAAFAFGAVKPAHGDQAGNLAFGVLLAGLDLTYRMNLGGDEDESLMSRLIRPRAGGFVWPAPLWGIGVLTMIVHATRGVTPQ